MLHYSNSEWVPSTEADVAAEKEQLICKLILPTIMKVIGGDSSGDTVIVSCISTSISGNNY